MNSREEYRQIRKAKKGIIEKEKSNHIEGLQREIELNNFVSENLARLNSEKLEVVKTLYDTELERLHQKKSHSVQEAELNKKYQNNLVERLNHQIQLGEIVSSNKLLLQKFESTEKIADLNHNLNLLNLDVEHYHSQIDSQSQRIELIKDQGEEERKKGNVKNTVISKLEELEKFRNLVSEKRRNSLEQYEKILLEKNEIDFQQRDVAIKEAKLDLLTERLKVENLKSNSKEIHEYEILKKQSSEERSNAIKPKHFIGFILRREYGISDKGLHVDIYKEWLETLDYSEEALTILGGLT